MLPHLAKSLEAAVKSNRGTCAAHEKESTAHGAIAGPFQRHRSGCPASQRLASTDSAGFTGQLMRCPHCSIIQPLEGASSKTFEGGYIYIYIIYIIILYIYYNIIYILYIYYIYIIYIYIIYIIYIYIYIYYIYYIYIYIYYIYIYYIYILYIDQTSSKRDFYQPVLEIDWEWVETAS